MIASAEAWIFANVDPFEPATASDEPRVFRAEVDGYVSTDRYPTYPTAVETSSYRAGPWTAVTRWEPANPPTATRSGRDIAAAAIRSGDWVRATSRWGWEAGLDDVAQAATLLSARLFAGQPAPAAAREANIAALLAAYRTYV